MKTTIKLYSTNNEQNQAFLERAIETLDFCYTNNKKEEYPHRYGQIVKNPRFDEKKAKINENRLISQGIYANQIWGFVLDLTRLLKYMKQCVSLQAGGTAYEPYEDIEFQYWSRI